MPRRQFEFVGSTSTRLSLDPTEYIDMSVPQITTDILRTLKAISPDVDYFEEDVVMAANDLAGG